MLAVAAGVSLAALCAADLDREDAADKGSSDGFNTMTIPCSIRERELGLPALSSPPSHQKATPKGGR
jgi:hypothetical protein